MQDSNVCSTLIIIITLLLALYKWIVAIRTGELYYRSTVSIHPGYFYSIVLHCPATPTLPHPIHPSSPINGAYIRSNMELTRLVNCKPNPLPPCYPLCPPPHTHPNTNTYTHTEAFIRRRNTASSEWQENENINKPHCSTVPRYSVLSNVQYLL